MMTNFQLEEWDKCGICEYITCMEIQTLITKRFLCCINVLCEYGVMLRNSRRSDTEVKTSGFSIDICTRFVLLLPFSVSHHNMH